MKSWYAVLTADVLYDKKLTSRQKILVAIIGNLSNEKGFCFASNKYLSELLGCSVSSLQRDLSALEGTYVGRVVKLNNKGEVDYRALTPVSSVIPPHPTSDTTPHPTGGTYNNKDSNNKDNTYTGVPNFEEFKEYGLTKSKEYNLEVSELSLKMKYDAWKEAKWVNGNGKKIRNWKASLTNTLKYLDKKEKSSGQKEKEPSSLDKLRELNQALKNGQITFTDE